MYLATNILSQLPIQLATINPPIRGTFQPVLYNSNFESIAFLLFYFVFGIIFLISLTLPFLVGYLVYKDAKKHNYDNPLLWAIISGINWIGLILYFVINKRDK